MFLVYPAFPSPASNVARMERSGMREVCGPIFLHCASLHQGYAGWPCPLKQELQTPGSQAGAWEPAQNCLPFPRSALDRSGGGFCGVGTIKLLNCLRSIFLLFFLSIFAFSYSAIKFYGIALSTNFIRIMTMISSKNFIHGRIQFFLCLL